MSDGKETMAARLFDARTVRGLTQGELARAAGLSLPQVYRLERGDGDEGRAMLATVAALARALDVDAGWLAYGTACAAPPWVKMRTRRRRGKQDED